MSKFARAAAELRELADSAAKRLKETADLLDQRSRESVTGMKRSDEIERFAEDATPEQKAEFAKKLVAALDDFGIAGGESFVITTEDDCSEVDNEVQARDEQITELECRDDGYDGLVEAVEDFERGIITKDELLEKARG
jgi:hypothetical protein